MHVVALALVLAAPTVEAPADWSCDLERWGDGICDCTCTASDDLDCGAPCSGDDDDDDDSDSSGDDATSCAQSNAAWAIGLFAGLRRRRRTD